MPRFRRGLKSSHPASLESQVSACYSAGARILLRGQIQARGSGYEVSLTAWQCAGGRRLTTESDSASSQAGILPPTVYPNPRNVELI